MEKSCIWNFTPVKNENRLPKSYKEFCDIYNVKGGECYISGTSEEVEYRGNGKRSAKIDKNVLPDRATAEAIIALCQLIQLRNAYNGDWVPNWKDDTNKYFLVIDDQEIVFAESDDSQFSPLYFKTREIREEFMRNFLPLIERLKPLYGIKEGGWE